MEVSRRKFLGTSAQAVIVAGALAQGRVFGANERLRGATIGFNGQGASHIKELVAMKDDVDMVALCDVDKNVMAKGLKLAMDGGATKEPKAYGDIRKLLEDKDVDFVTIAMPNHWHTLASVWACQAGKDVYVEKPFEGGIWEGRQLVAAAEKYKRVVQHGTQGRSDKKLIRDMDLIHKGFIGDIVHSRGYVYKNGNRGNIGMGKVANPPDHLDFTLWQGPSPEHPYQVREGSDQGLFVHYNWHWFWEYGNGEIGNQGVHQMDVLSWVMAGKVPVKVQSMGGRFGEKDAGETPNTHATTFTYGDGTIATFEVRNMGSYNELNMKQNCSNTAFGTKGYWGREAGFFDYKNNPIEVPADTPMPEGGNKWVRFIKAMRTRKPEDNPAGPEVAHPACMHIHMGNIAYRVGRTLTFDPKTERFSDEDANKFLKREYRKGFEVPQLA